MQGQIWYYSPATWNMRHKLNEANGALLICRAMFLATPFSSLTIWLKVPHATRQRHALPASHHEPPASDQKLGRPPSPKKTLMLLLLLIPLQRNNSSVRQISTWLVPFSVHLLWPKLWGIIALLTLCFVPSVAVFYKALLTCSTGRWADTALSACTVVQPNW